MFIVTHKDGEKKGWDAGKPKPSSVNVLNVTMISATNEALDEVFNKLDNIPFPRSTSVRGAAWYGDMAKFIFANL